MNDDYDFVERLLNREIPRTDQREAHNSTAKHQERVQQTIRDTARSAFAEMRSCAERLMQIRTPARCSRPSASPKPTDRIFAALEPNCRTIVVNAADRFALPIRRSVNDAREWSRRPGDV
jgi:hypothetical protein